MAKFVRLNDNQIVNIDNVVSISKNVENKYNTITFGLDINYGNYKKEYVCVGSCKFDAKTSIDEYTKMLNTFFAKLETNKFEEK